MSLLDPRVWGALLLSVVISAGVGYVRGHSAGVSEQKTEQAKAVQAWQENAETAYGMYLEGLDRKQVQYRTITKTVEVAKHATPDIADCRTGDDWMRIYRDNAAIANGAAMPAGAGSAVGTDAR